MAFFFIFIPILVEQSISKQCSAASDLGLHCLSLSHIKEAGLKWVSIMIIYQPTTKILISHTKIYDLD